MVNEEKVYDLAIVGRGPAGVSAAVNAEARGLDYIVLGSEEQSRKLLQAPEVNNYPGFPEISGKELAEKFSQHLNKLEGEKKDIRIDNIYDQPGQFTLMGSDSTIMAHSLILAVGMSTESYLPGEEELVGKGVSYCATCDGPLYKNKKIAGIVYTEEGIEDINYLAEIAETVYLYSDIELDEDMKEKVDIISKQPEQIIGENKVKALELSDGQQVEVEAVFVFRQVTPPDKLLTGLKVEDNHLQVNRKMETNKEGVYAAGDCTGQPYQIGKAVGEGQIAALEAASYVRKLD